MRERVYVCHINHQQPSSERASIHHIKLKKNRILAFASFSRVNPRSHLQDVQIRYRPFFFIGEAIASPPQLLLLLLLRPRAQSRHPRRRRWNRAASRSPHEAQPPRL